MTDITQASASICRNCAGEGWVCENHETLAWPSACQCGAGAPCPVCRREMAAAGMIQAAFQAGVKAGLEAAAEAVRELIPVLPPDGPSSSEQEAEYLASGHALQAIRAIDPTSIKDTHP